MALGFGSYDRMERMLLKTRNILGENDDTLKEENKIQALQYAASLYSLYDGDGSETDYTDSPTLVTTVLYAELIATAAAIELITSAVSYYKDDVVNATGGPASVTFRSDKLAWLEKQVEMLQEKQTDLESQLGYSDSTDVPGLCIAKARACQDPVDDVCCDDEDIANLDSGTVGSGS